MKPLTLTVSAFCQASGVDRTKTYDLIRAGELDIVKIGRRTLITVASAEALIDRQRRRPSDFRP